MLLTPPPLPFQRPEDMTRGEINRPRADKPLANVREDKKVNRCASGDFKRDASGTDHFLSVSGTNYVGPNCLEPPAQSDSSSLSMAGQWYH
ncbi:hypothetical protein BaRGS_00006835 [Batillaria attramentaria]|uniref:Uncharacterized protein n=1 Tax=Batillaria attramentaria TaxID=370345 RepID=A0ABD0LSN1_9CAEN